MRNIDLIVIHRNENGSNGAELKVNAPGEYHLFVRRDGIVDLTLGFELRGAHAIGFNHNSIGIAVHGDFDPAPHGAHYLYQYPTQAQLDALECLVLGLQWWLGKSLYVNGHTELPKASADPKKVCPGKYLNMHELRRKTGTQPYPGYIPQVV